MLSHGATLNVQSDPHERPGPCTYFRGNMGDVCPALAYKLDVFFFRQGPLGMYSIVSANFHTVEFFALGQH